MTTSQAAPMQGQEVGLDGISSITKEGWRVIEK